MEYHFSTSITKIKEFPILPPLITNNITTEIQYYKQLAMAVEERLRALETVKRTALDNDKQEENKNSITVPMEDGDIPTGFNVVKQDMTSIDEIIMDYPTKDKIEENLIDINTPTNEKAKSDSFINKDIISSESMQQNIEKMDKSMSDDDKSYLNETLLCTSVSSDTISISTDLNQYLNTSASIRTDTSDTTPENWKPQVPKTLNIVPITVDKLKSSDQPNLMDEETPRLVRRGSYVLDAPSPMLLALIQNESTNTKTRTSIPSVQSSRCKEWNGNKIKRNWENQTNFKEPTRIRLNSGNKCRKGNHTNIPSQRVCRSVSNSKTCSPLDIYQPAKSVDCIQAMFIKELYSPKTANSRSNHQSKIYSSPFNGTNGIRNYGLKENIKNTSILNLANKLSGSLGSLSNVSPKPFKSIAKRNNNSLNLNSEKNFNSTCEKSNDSNVSLKKKKAVITSEKIVTVFREIQDTHKKQMIELMTRQQKEQIIMQENFKKQQILLLAQIRKAFPEISISALSEAISVKNAEHNVPLNSKTVNKGSDSIKKQKDIEKPQVNGINYEKGEDTIIKSSVNCTYQSKDLSSTSSHFTIQPATTICSFHQSNYQPSQMFNDSSTLSSRVQLSNIRAIDDIPVGSPIRRHSNVSRQLFPLDNKIVRVLILDNSAYTEKHIKAVTIINAYTKGYLVRRLMKTEKIIALKNTYKEALHCMLRLHVDEPLQVAEVRFKKRLQQQCDAASMNIVDLFSQNPANQMEIIAHDREIKTARSDRPSSAHSYSFATQRTLARKKLKEMGVYPSLQGSVMSKSCPVRTRCQTWTPNSKEKKTTTSLINQGIKRSTSASAVRKPWR